MPRFLTKTEEDEFRQELCDVATRLFTDRGFTAVTMRSLADQLGCSRTTPYRYFKDKADILATVRAAGFARLADRLTSVDAADDVIDRVRLLARHYIAFAREEPDVYRLMFETNQPDTKAHPILDAQIDRNRQAVRTVAQEAVAAGRLAGDPVVLARLFWAALHGLVELHLDNKFKPDHDITTLSSEMISALIAGMVPSTYNPA